MRWVERILMSVAVALLGVAVLAASAVAQAHPATPAPTESDWLFTVNFRSAALVAGDKGTGQATLTLSGVDTDVLAFTDQPQRRAAVVPVAAFVPLLDGAAADPPNALLVTGRAGENEGFQAVLILRSASADRDAGTVTFAVTVTERQSDGTPVPARDGGQELPASYLFVDDLQVPVDVPVNVCGNAESPIGGLNPAMGNVCANGVKWTPAYAVSGR